jgi:hypothetical protein
MNQQDYSNAKIHVLSHEHRVLKNLFFQNLESLFDDSKYEFYSAQAPEKNNHCIEEWFTKTSFSQSDFFIYIPPHLESSESVDILKYLELNNAYYIFRVANAPQFNSIQVRYFNNLFAHRAIAAPIHLWKKLLPKMNQKKLWWWHLYLNILSQNQNIQEIVIPEFKNILAPTSQDITIKDIFQLIQIHPTLYPDDWNQISQEFSSKSSNENLVQYDESFSLCEFMLNTGFAVRGPDIRNAFIDLLNELKMDSSMNQEKSILPHTIQPKPKIAFYALRELHLPILIPVLDELRKKFAYDCMILFPSYKAGENGIPEEGIHPSSVKELILQGYDLIEDLNQKNKFNAVICADAFPERIEGYGPSICVGHGTISKNIYFIDNTNVLRENYHSVLCVPGPWYTTAFGNKVHCQIAPTGFPKLDKLSQDYSQFKSEFFIKINFQNHRKTILFAPTYNIEFTGMFMLASEWAKLSPQKYQILVKLHGATDPALSKSYEKLCSLLPNLHFVKDQDIIPYLKCADILISDVSSAYVEGYLCDIPVLVVNNPQMKECSLYNPDTVEFRVRDGAYQINHESDLHRILYDLECGVDPLFNKRKEYASLLFPPLDGKNTERVCEIINQVVEKPFAHTDSLFLNILIAPNSNQSLINENLNRLKFHHKIWVFHSNDLKKYPNSELWDKNKLGNGNFLFLKGNLLLSNEWDFIYHLSKKFHLQLNCFVPTINHSKINPKQNYTQFTKQEIDAKEELKRAFFKYRLLDQGAPISSFLWDGLLWNHSSFDEIHPFIDQFITQDLALIPCPAMMCMGQLAYELS